MLQKIRKRLKDVYRSFQNPFVDGSNSHYQNKFAKTLFTDIHTNRHRYFSINCKSDSTVPNLSICRLTSRSCAIGSNEYAQESYIKGTDETQSLTNFDLTILPHNSPHLISVHIFLLRACLQRIRKF